MRLDDPALAREPFNHQMPKYSYQGTAVLFASERKQKTRSGDPA